MSWYLQLPASSLFLLIYLLLLLNKPDADVQSTPHATLLTSQCHHQSSASKFKLLSKDIPTRSSTPAGTDVDAEVLSYISASKTHDGDESLAYWNSTSAFPSLAPLAQDLLAAPAPQAYEKCVFSVCGHLNSGEKSSLQKLKKIVVQNFN